MGEGMMEGMVEGTVEVRWRMLHSMPEGLREGQQRNRLRGAQGLPAPLKGPKGMAMAAPDEATMGHMVKTTRAQRS